MLEILDDLFLIVYFIIILNKYKFNISLLFNDNFTFY
jgi:hypothetical protein